MLFDARWASKTRDMSGDMLAGIELELAGIELETCLQWPWGHVGPAAGLRLLPYGSRLLRTPYGTSVCDCWPFEGYFRDGKDQPS